nr:S8 family serine peptidase [Luteolibacter marinus]
MVPNGAVTDAGWALARLNDGANLNNQSFTYPETSNPVRLFLIDSGIAAADTWFSRNPNLVIEHSELVRASGDPTYSNAVEHGSRMLSLIAGPETGAALGTPVHLVSLNIYPGDEGSTTTSGRMIDAIDRVIEYQALHEDMPGVICLASGSSTPGKNSAQLESIISEARDAGITVIVCAGNQGGDAAEYVPSAYGVQDGVICVGASDADNQHLANTNQGPAVDLYAPGQQVRTLNLPTPESGSYYLMNGTSPATALATAAAIIELSKNPGLSPQEVENALTADAFTVSQNALIQVHPDPEVDSDGDGCIDLLETFFGTNPADPAATPEPLVLSRTGNQLRLEFEMAADLFVPGTPFTLSNGSTWKIRCSENLQDWTEADGSLSTGAASGAKLPVTFTLPASAKSCFLQVEVSPAP